jgi:hypothetical protein
VLSGKGGLDFIYKRKGNRVQECHCGSDSKNYEILLATDRSHVTISQDFVVIIE